MEMSEIKERYQMEKRAKRNTQNFNNTKFQMYREQCVCLRYTIAKKNVRDRTRDQREEKKKKTMEDWS